MGGVCERLREAEYGTISGQGIRTKGEQRSCVLRANTGRFERLGRFFWEERDIG
jgi:hypothetical protein